ncbi:hypothetical protein BsWGS_00939 [Bradybaena similaris]
MLFHEPGLQAAPASGEYCTSYSYWSTYRTFHCTFGCCGPSSDQYCCAGNAGAIVGIVLGAICAIAVVATIICCCVKQHNHRGQVIHQAPGAGTFVASHTTSSNIFVVPTGGPPSHNSPYPMQYNNVYGGPGRPPTAFPAPPGYSQPGFPVAPGYNQTGVLQPPTYNQTGVLQPPTYNQTGVLQPPTHSQAGATPPTYSQVGGFAAAYSVDDSNLSQKPPAPTST